ncbi:hypothetical protein KP509_33G052500 [Ceratopteris richardii]|uniref:Glycosyltransferase n=2 Tax=Ceratopteris richardii TaxID=49495 RepID=A0A8T2QQR5_CERRI|nr:hypothetical protein KP509_33G052500 [Ceratopteris richardii]
MKHHAIVFAWPGQGHLNPLLWFSELLVMYGCKVTFTHNFTNLDRVKQAARATARASNSCEAAIGDVKLSLMKDHKERESNEDETEEVEYVGSDDGIDGNGERDLMGLITATDADRQGGLVSAFDPLVGRLVTDSRYNTFIVSDFFMCFTQDVANKYGVPRVAVYVQSASSFACHVSVSQGFCPTPGSQLLNLLPEVLPPTLHTTEMISFLQDYDPSDPVYDYMIRPFKRVHEPAWIVLNTFDELEHGVIAHLQNSLSTVKHLQCSGPLLPRRFVTRKQHSNKFTNHSLWKEDLDCLMWLDEQPLSSVLFVSLGSLATISVQQAEEFAFGLESSNVPFVWVIREGLIQGGDLPAGFRDRVRGRPCLVRWAPQLKVLGHPSVGGFLTHSGWNSTLESISAGVPMLGWSLFGDQMLVCQCWDGLCLGIKCLTADALWTLGGWG